MNLFSSFSTGMDVADMAWEVRCREEDMRQRALDNTRRLIDDARRAVDEKAEQLKAVSSLSALIAGFGMVVLVEMAPLPEDLNGVLCVLFGLTASSAVALMLLAMLNSTFLLIAILKYDCVKRTVPFETFWNNSCEMDWRISYGAFTTGVPMFMALLAQIGWITFHASEMRNVAAGAVSAVAIVSLGAWFVYTYHKWGNFLGRLQQQS